MASARPSIARFALAAAIAAMLLVAPGVAQGKVSASLSGSLLTVTGGKGSDHITVLCRNGAVKVNGKSPRTGATACSKVSEVDVVAGSGNDRVNLSGVGPDSGFGQRDLPGGFGHGTGAAADLGRGNDRYVGGASAGGPADASATACRAAAATTPPWAARAVTYCWATRAMTSSTGAPTTICSAATRATTSSPVRPART